MDRAGTGSRAHAARRRGSGAPDRPASGRVGAPRGASRSRESASSVSPMDLDEPTVDPDDAVGRGAAEHSERSRQREHVEVGDGVEVIEQGIRPRARSSCVRAIPCRGGELAVPIVSIGVPPVGAFTGNYRGARAHSLREFRPVRTARNPWSAGLLVRRGPAARWPWPSPTPDGGGRGRGRPRSPSVRGTRS